ncbi:DUF397 domain-containing protein [Streptomyces sp. NPDC002143]
MRATHNLSVVQWRKSSYSDGEPGGECVEVASGVTDLVPVRDSKAPLAPGLTFTPDTWGAFIVALKNGTAPTI